MTDTKIFEQSEANAERPTSLAIKRGFSGRCPCCGEGRLFKKFLKVDDQCPTCGEPLHHHRADDLPAYLVVMIVGHIVVGAFMATDMVFDLKVWQHLLIWIPITTIFTLALLQPVKGAVVGLQWALRMHGFGDKPDYDDPAPAENIGHS